MLASLGRAQAAQALGSLARCVSAATGDVVDEMVSYARSNFRASEPCKRKYQGFPAPS